MTQFLAGFRLDRGSFWLGFVAGILALWLFDRLRPVFIRLTHKLFLKAQAARDRLTAGTEVHHRNDTLRMAQRQHLAALLFSLDEILIEPHVLAPPPPVQPGLPPADEDSTCTALPYLPDWPELAAAYQAPTLTLLEALQGGANLVLTGHPGSGKSVALAYLAALVARQDPQAGGLSGRLPLLVHVANLSLTGRAPAAALESLTGAVVHTASPLIRVRLPALLQSALQNGRVLLLLDGLDELPRDEFGGAVEFLAKLLQRYPNTRVVATAQPDFSGGLGSLGFIPVALALWSETQVRAFLERWREGWTLVAAPGADREEPVDPILLNSWIGNDQMPVTPLELTLAAWASYSGDALGPAVADHIEAYVQRLSAGLPNARPLLEHLAVAALSERTPWVSRSSVVQSHPDLLAALADRDLLRSYSESRLALAHPVISAYLVAYSQAGAADQIFMDRLHGSWEWIGEKLALEFFLAVQGDSPLADQWIGRCLEDGPAPLFPGLWLAGRWLRHASEKSAWGTPVLRRLAGILQAQDEPLALRSRAMVALAAARSSGVEVLFRQLLSSRDPALRQMGALGAGLVRDHKGLEALSRLLSDPDPTVQRAASLALIRLDRPEALDAVAGALLQGDEGQRRGAAEALANHRNEGHPVLREASLLDDLHVRRAAVYGLRRIHEPWAIETLKRMQLEDEQWVVKTAASQVLEALERPDPRIPQPHPALSASPWLISFAGERGIGVGQGKAALVLCLLALKEGDEGQQFAALEALSQLGEARAAPLVQELYQASQGDLREAAFNALWRLHAAGIPLSGIRMAVPAAAD